MSVFLIPLPQEIQKRLLDLELMELWTSECSFSTIGGKCVSKVHFEIAYQKCIFEFVVLS